MNVMKKIDLLHPGTLAFLFGTGSLLPQFYKVFSTHDIDSFSLVFIALGFASNTCWILNGAFYTEDMAQVGSASMWVLFYVYLMYLVVMQRTGALPRGEAKDKHHIIKGAQLKTVFNKLL